MDSQDYEFFCTCESFGCGKIVERKDALGEIYGRCLGSRAEFYEHVRADKRRIFAQEDPEGEPLHKSAPSSSIALGSGSTTKSRLTHPSNTQTLSTEQSNSAAHNVLSATVTENPPMNTLEAELLRNQSQIERIAERLDLWNTTLEQHRVADSELSTLISEEPLTAYGGRHRSLAVTYNEEDLRIEKQFERAYRYQKILEEMETSIEGIGTLGVPELEKKKSDLMSSIKQNVENLKIMYRGLDKETFVDVSQYARNMQKLKSLNPIVLGSFILLAVLHLICGVSMNDCSFVLGTLGYLLHMAYAHASAPLFDSESESASFFANADERQLSWEYLKIVKSIPKDIRTVISDLGLEPTYEAMACCPKCFSCYAIDRCPSRCVYKRTVSSDVCGRTLLKQQKKNRISPVEQIYFQDFKAWVGQLLSRPGMEELLERTAVENHTSDGDIMKDIWDGNALKDLLGPDGQPFIGKYGSEGRLIFTLSMDGFNPFRNKQAGKKVTVGAVYMVCLNLPPDIRHNPENIFLACIIPGPRSPSLEQMNHILRPLVDVLLPFWKVGFYYSDTPSHPEGRLIRCAIAPLICDLPAARQVAGFSSYASNLFCSFCKLTLNQIDNLTHDDLRTNVEHREHARQWLNAETVEERDALTKTLGIRFSELLRFPYFDIVRFTVLDPMHALLLGNLHRHCRTVWQMNFERNDGNGEFNKVSAKSASATELKKALEIVQHGTLEDLKKLRVLALEDISLRLGLRSAGKTKENHIEALNCLRIEKGWPSENPMPHKISTVTKTSESQPGSQNVRISGSEEKETQLEQSLSEEMAILEEILLNAPSTDGIKRKLKKDELVDLCESKSLGTAEDLRRETKPKLAARLTQWRKDNGIADENGKLIKMDKSRLTGAEKMVKKIRPTAVLGKGRLQEIWKDMNRCTFPSWLSPAPSRIGDGKHGKLNADQWRTFGTIHLVITLIRLWGHLPKESRENKLLLNFLNIARATKLAMMRNISRDQIQVFRTCMLDYLEGVMVLFPGVALSPNQHLSLHLSTLLEDFGPTHAWRTFSVERTNFLLQQVSTSRKFELEYILVGELEKTMLDRFCKSQNLRYLMRESWMTKTNNKIAQTFEHVFEAGKNGTFFGDIGAFHYDRLPDHLSDDTDHENSVMLTEEIELLLGDHIKEKYPIYYRNGTQPIHPWVHFQPYHDLRGVTYATEKRSKGDCYVIIGYPQSNWCAARIERIFRHRMDNRRKETSLVYFLIRNYRSLSGTDANLDNFRKFPDVGGKLFYDVLEEKQELIEASEVSCHFVLTEFQEADTEVNKKCIHALPLDR